MHVLHNHFQSILIKKDEIMKNRLKKDCFSLHFKKTLEKGSTNIIIYNHIHTI